MTPEPRYSVRRRPDRPTYGGQVATIARRIGMPLMPWQRHVADVALEVADDGRFAYRRVIVAVPRRAGKSQLILSMALWRMAAWRRQRLWYTAQNGKTVSQLWRQDWSQQLEMSPAGHLFRFRASQGREEFEHLPNGSYFTAFAPQRASLHSQAGDVVIFDECWELTVERGTELMQAAGPLLMTRPMGQLYFVSAAGDAQSTWWNALREQGRTAAEVDLGHGVAHFEWTAEGDGRDRGDPDLWRDVHPAVGHTIRVEDLADERAAEPDLFNRQYLNITETTTIAGARIDLDRWLAATTAAGPPAAGDVTYGVDATPGLEVTSVVAAYADGRIVELVDREAGHLWAIDRLSDLCDRYGPPAVALDSTGPARALAAPLQAAGVPVQLLGVNDTAAAAAQLAAAVTIGDCRNVPDPAMDDAVAGGRPRTIGDGVWTWSRTSSPVDVSPIIAAGLARFVHPTVHAGAAAIL